MKSCDTCTKRDECTRSTGALFGGCNIEYKPDVDAIYKRLDNLESCKDNPVYAREIAELRMQLQ